MIVPPLPDLLAALEVLDFSDYQVGQGTLVHARRSMDMNIPHLESPRSCQSRLGSGHHGCGEVPDAIYPARGGTGGGLGRSLFGE